MIDWRGWAIFSTCKEKIFYYNGLSYLDFSGMKASLFPLKIELKSNRRDILSETYKPTSE